MKVLTHEASNIRHTDIPTNKFIQKKHPKVTFPTNH